MPTRTSILFVCPQPPQLRMTHLGPGLVSVMALAAAQGNVDVDWQPLQWHDLTLCQVDDCLRRSGAKILALPVYSDGHHRIERVISGLLEYRTDLAIVVGGPHIEAVNKGFLPECDRLFRCATSSERDLSATFALAIEAVGGLHMSGEGFYKGDRRLGQGTIDYSILETCLNQTWREARPILITSLGCDRQCTFCTEPTRVGGLLLRSMESIERELLWLCDNLTNRFFMIADDNLLRKKWHTERVIEVLNTAISHHPDIRFFWLARPEDVVQHQDVVRQFSSLHIHRVQLGLESGCPNMRKRYGKFFSNNTIRQAVEVLYNAGIPSVVGSLIIGGPFEDEVSIETSISLIEELVISAPGVFEPEIGFLRPYPGIPLLQDIGKGLYPIPGIQIGSTVDDRPFFETPALNEGGLFEARDAFTDRVHKAMTVGCDNVEVEAWIHKYEGEQYTTAESQWITVFKESPNCRGMLELKADLRGESLQRLPPTAALSARPRCTLIIPYRAFQNGCTLPFGRSRGIRTTPRLAWLLAACNGERSLREILDCYTKRFPSDYPLQMDEIWETLTELTLGKLLVWDTSL
jgi:radical SAM family protein